MWFGGESSMAVQRILHKLFSISKHHNDVDKAKLCLPNGGVAMKDCFYWIHHNGRVQFAYYSNGVTQDLETGLSFKGILHLT